VYPIRLGYQADSDLLQIQRRGSLLQDIERNGHKGIGTPE
jgi:hypothetical protein